MPKILVINGSARKEGDTQKIVNQLMEGIVYEQINLIDHYFVPYHYNGIYPEEDCFGSFAKEILYFDHLIFATPVYWFAMSGRMKNFFDRLTDWITTEKEVGRKLKGKTMHVIAVGTDGELPDGFATPFFSTANYFDMIYKGHLYFISTEPIQKNETEKIQKHFLNFATQH